MLVYLDKGWCLLLLKEFKWDKDMLREEYFNNLDYYQKRIGLRMGLASPTDFSPKLGVCYVCCCENVLMFRNICGH